ncbi:hypothetical protein ScPMuIL_007430 [Solemya velum]
MSKKGLVERLNGGDNVIVAEGYLFEFERRGYLKAGTFVPEVVIEQPDLVKSLHEEYVHAGSDVTLAFTYYGHREKLKFIGREADIETLNVQALKIAKEVADKTGTLMAGNICNSTIYEKNNQEANDMAKAMFKEQIQWAVQYGADFIVAETFSDFGEASLALECVKQYGNGLPAVVSFITSNSDETLDGIPVVEACKRLEDAGAAVVGLNCGRGPRTMMPLVRKIRHACKGPIAALPVPYRTTVGQPTFQSLQDPETGKAVFPEDLPAFLCSRSQIVEFATEAKEVGVQYVGLCCGSSSHCLRVLAEVYGRQPPACKYSPDMSKHFMWGKDPHFKKYYTEGLRNEFLKEAI